MTIPPDPTPVEPRDAATVLLLRERHGLEVYVMVRQATMEFAAGAAVFPGGGVAPVDATDAVAAAAATGWGARMDCLDELAGAVVACAVRETQEETGVVLRAGDLGLWDAWTTPERSPVRYRTWFFTAALPDGQEPAELSTESSSARWVRPAEALDLADEGSWDLRPPTYSAMLRLATFGTVAEVMAATREASVRMYTPTYVGDRTTVPAWAEELKAARG